jgi:hypothetical protein
VPQPDHLTITVPITPKVYGHGESVDDPVEDFMKKLGQHFKDGPANTEYVTGKFFPNYGWRDAILRVGSRSSSIRFEYLKSKKDGTRLRIELNPRKLGPSGFKKLSKILDDGKGPFNLTEMINAARLTRLDIAVDIVGVQVSEVLVWHKAQGKRSIYMGADGLMETLYVHRRLITKKQDHSQGVSPKKLSHSRQPAGKPLVRIYDRVRERAALLKSGPFGPAPVTRVELVIDKFHPNWAPLAKLPALSDRFSTLRVGFRDSQVAMPGSLWQRFAGIRRTMPHNATVALTGLVGDEAEYAAAALVPSADMISPGENWQGWAQGMKATGLLSFVQVSV